MIHQRQLKQSAYDSLRPIPNPTIHRSRAECAAGVGREVKIEDTHITIAGVMRCCLMTVGREYQELEDGAESSCLYCDERFRLVAGTWKPLWQLEASSKNRETA